MGGRVAPVQEERYLKSYEKLLKSYEEAVNLKTREIRCPYCNYVVGEVFEDARGHQLVKCQKCKRKSVINFAYFRRQQKRYR